MGNGGEGRGIKFGRTRGMGKNRFVLKVYWIGGEVRQGIVSEVKYLIERIMASVIRDDGAGTIMPG